jgi:RNA polymerase sigma-70 factor, ECF subfamily
LTATELDFDQFYATHFAALGVQLYAYFGDRAEAQDIAQEAFCRAWQRWSQVSTYEDPVAWVRKVAWRLAISRWRRAKTALAFVRRQREEHVPEVSPDRVALAAALATLPAQQRRAVVLHYLAGMQVAEIATQEGVADGTVKSWLHRARGALAARLTEETDRNQEVGYV